MNVWLEMGTFEVRIRHRPVTDLIIHVLTGSFSDNLVVFNKKLRMRTQTDRSLITIIGVSNSSSSSNCGCCCCCNSSRCSGNNKWKCFFTATFMYMIGKVNEAN